MIVFQLHRILQFVNILHLGPNSLHTCPEEYCIPMCMDKTPEMACCERLSVQNGRGKDKYTIAQNRLRLSSSSPVLLQLWLLLKWLRLSQQLQTSYSTLVHQTFSSGRSASSSHLQVETDQLCPSFFHVVYGYLSIKSVMVSPFSSWTNIFPVTEYTRNPTSTAIHPHHPLLRDKGSSPFSILSTIPHTIEMLYTSTPMDLTISKTAAGLIFHASYSAHLQTMPNSRLSS